ncbi:Leucine-responsive regulatory protein [Carnimonas sp. R-84981]|uniref:Lrp/AsnC family transcriptional regulator n=1 Tax=Carnimonas bestiolae TaxID=3402172 RepID=UPI003EDB789F
MKLDNYDLKILQILSRNGRITKSKLAEQINLSVSPCWERVKRLEQAGIIEGYGARINRAAQEKRLSVWVQIELSQHKTESFSRFEQAMADCAEVSECHAVGGGLDYLVRVDTLSIERYQQLIDTWLDANLAIARYYTYVVTKSIKQATPPLP